MADKDSISICSQGSSCIVDDTYDNRLVPVGKSGNELAQVDDPNIQHPVHQSPVNMQVTAENIDHVGTKINNITLVLNGSHVKARNPDYLASVIKDNLEIIEASGTKVQTNQSILTIIVALGFIVLFMVVCSVTLVTLGNTDQFGQSNHSKSSVKTESVNQPVSTFSYIPQKPVSVDRRTQPVRDSTTKRNNDYSNTYTSNLYPSITYTYRNRTIFNSSFNAASYIPQTVYTQLNRTFNS